METWSLLDTIIASSKLLIKGEKKRVCKFKTTQKKDKKQSTEYTKSEMKGEDFRSPLRCLQKKKKSDAGSLIKQSDCTESCSVGVHEETQNDTLPSVLFQLETSAKENELAPKKILCDAD